MEPANKSNTEPMPKMASLNNIIPQKKIEPSEVCGCNFKFSISEASNDVDKYGIPIVDPPEPIIFPADTISSYSTYYNKTIIVTISGTVFGIGENDKGQISNSIPNQVNDKFTKIFSAVCGIPYALYLIKENEKSEQYKLAYAHPNVKNIYPVILKTGKLEPVAIYGSDSDCAAIDIKGSIIYLYEPSISKSFASQIDPVYLPANNKAASIAWSKENVYLLSWTNRLFESKKKQKPTFTEVTELKGIEIINISGFQDHCIAISKDNRVFVIGSNSDGQLGFDKKIKDVKKFTENEFFKDLKIVEAFAGSYHSLFKTSNGEIYSCGYNDYGQLILDRSVGKNVFKPTKTNVSDVSFCVAGGGSTAIFRYYRPLMNSNTFVDVVKEEEEKKRKEEEKKKKEEEEKNGKSGKKT